MGESKVKKPRAVKVPKEKKEKVIKEEVVAKRIIPTMEEALANIKTTQAETGVLPERSLSEPARKWKAYLALQKLTPEQFLEKYKVHKYRYLVEEILEFEKNK